MHRPNTLLSRARRWPLLRSLLVWVSCVVLLAQVGHMTLVSHVVCSAHGDLHHGSEAPQKGLAEATQHESTAAAHPTETADGHGESQAHESDGEDAHDHCDAIGTEAAHSVAPATPQVVKLSWAMDVARSTAPGTMASRRLYQLAPKTSPPARRS